MKKPTKKPTTKKPKNDKGFSAGWKAGHAATMNEAAKTDEERLRFISKLGKDCDELRDRLRQAVAQLDDEDIIAATDHQDGGRNNGYLSDWLVNAKALLRKHDKRKKAKVTAVSGFTGREIALDDGPETDGDQYDE